MNREELIQKFKEKPYLKTMGKGSITKWLNCSEEDVIWVKKHLKDNKTDKSIEKKGARILIFDIETSPIISYTWGVRKQFIHSEQIIRDFTILTFAAKWLDSDEIITGTCKGNIDDDFEVVEKLYHLFDEADIIVAHNLERFDRKKTNTRFLAHGLPNPSPYKCVDTLKISRQNFGTTYHKLDFLSKFIGSEGKMEHEGFNLWKRCMEDDDEAFDTMLEYNIQDVYELEKVYLTIRSFDSRHPSVSIFNENPEFACTKCGSSNLEYIKDSYTNTRVYKLYKCSDCGGFSRSRTSENKSKVLMTQ